jgi:ATP-dependent helicase HepA
MSDWQAGHKLIHPFNPELGTGVVRAAKGRFIDVWFPAVDREVTLNAKDGGLKRLIMRKGHKAMLLETGEEVEIEQVAGDGDSYLLYDGRTFPEGALWPLPPAVTPIDKIAEGRIDGLRAFRNTVDSLRLASLREAGGLGSFLGGRIELFPHQLHTALRATERDPVRWLLADEVGLGKTIEACLILTALLRTGRAEKALIVTPDTLTIQWLGELWRKFHTVFVLLDDERIADVVREYGDDANPFDVYPFTVASMRSFADNPMLGALAAGAGLDVVVIDEAHRLLGGPAEVYVTPLVESARHALLLTATPLQSDRVGFHRLLTLLRPDAVPPFEEFSAQIDRGDCVVGHTSSVRRSAVGGLPPRVPMGVDVGPAKARISDDPRTAWLEDHVRTSVAKDEKLLVFLRDLPTLKALKKRLELQTQIRCAEFHEEMSSERRDVELAGFRIGAGGVLLCTEAGEEGRNFQFCDRMIHWDLPDDPVALEQRIGRLDRIGRDRDVEIVYFRQEGAKPDKARLYERLGLFERPSAGLEPALVQVREALAAGDPDMDALVARVERDRATASEDVANVLYADAYDGDAAITEEVMAKVPEDLESAVQEFVLHAADDLGFDVIEKGDEVWYLELGAGGRVDSLPGVPGDSRFLGTFSRKRAVEGTELEFFASGHPLVDGLLGAVQDRDRGRAAVLEFAADDTDIDPGALGLLGLWVRPDRTWAATVVDGDGTPQPDWVDLLLEDLSEAKAKRAQDVQVGPAWERGIKGLGAKLLPPDESAELVAAAFFKVEDD